MASHTPQALTGLPPHLAQFATLNDVWLHLRQLRRALNESGTTLDCAREVGAALQTLEQEVGAAWMAAADATAADDAEGVDHV